MEKGHNGFIRALSCFTSMITLGTCIATADLGVVRAEGISPNGVHDTNKLGVFLGDEVEVNIDEICRRANIDLNTRPGETIKCTTYVADRDDYLSRISSKTVRHMKEVELAKGELGDASVIDEINNLDNYSKFYPFLLLLNERSNDVVHEGNKFLVPVNFRDLESYYQIMEVNNLDKRVAAAARTVIVSEDKDSVGYLVRDIYKSMFGLDLTDDQVRTYLDMVGINVDLSTKVRDLDDLGYKYYPGETIINPDDLVRKNESSKTLNYKM